MHIVRKRAVSAQFLKILFVQALRRPTLCAHFIRYVSHSGTVRAAVATRGMHVVMCEGAFHVLRLKGRNK